MNEATGYLTTVRSLKRAETRNYKRFLKKNLPNVGMAAWMEALADKVHRQG